MDDISVSKALAFPAVLAATTIALAAAISLYTGVSGWWAFQAYLGAWAAATFLTMLIWAFVEIARLMPSRADHPLRTVSQGLRERALIAPLPAIIFPLFLGGYTWAKCSIPFAVGYGWEGIWANADRLIFGMDAWRWAHGLFPDATAQAWTIYYAAVWAFALLFSGTLIGAFASRRFIATFFTAMMLSWLIGGIVLAYSMSAAGPVFAHLVNPELGGQFLPLRAELARLLPADDWVLQSQRYLEARIGTKVAVKGGGVSAMPSMHIATATILILAAWKTRWLALALLLWVLTFLGSIYLGYHYAVDAPVAALVAICCWLIARRFYRRPAANLSGELTVPIAVALQAVREPGHRP